MKPFRVICIDDSNWWSIGNSLRTVIKPKFGEIFIAIDTKKAYNELYYAFDGIKGVWYMAKYFAPLSEIDETEMIRETKKELI